MVPPWHLAARKEGQTRRRCGDALRRHAVHMPAHSHTESDAARTATGGSGSTDNEHASLLNTPLPPCDNRARARARARVRNGTHGRSASPSAPPPLSLLPPSQSVSTLSSHHASTHSKPLSKHGQATPFSSHRERNIPRRQRLCSEIWCGGGGRHPTRAWPITHPSQHTGIARAPARLVTAWPPSASGREQARRASCSTVAPSSSCHPSRREQCRRAPSLRRGPPSWSSAPNPAWPWPWWGRR